MTIMTKAQVLKELRTTYKGKHCIVGDKEVSAKDLIEMVKSGIASPSFVQAYFM